MWKSQLLPNDVYRWQGKDMIQENLSLLYQKPFVDYLQVESSYHLHGHDGCVNAISFSSDGRFLVSGSDDTYVKIWDYDHKKCLKTLPGHISNVFATIFPYGDNNTVISGGNDSDIRIFDIEKHTCTVLHQHTRKVLCIKGDPNNPFLFLSCSSDSTVRRFDLRMKYEGSDYEKSVPHDGSSSSSNTIELTRPQAMGGGRILTPSSERKKDTIIVDDHSISFYSLDIHPRNPYHFIVSGGDQNVRLFDQRMIKDSDSPDYVNIYRAVDEIRPHGGCDSTGCSFSHNGNEIIASNLNSGSIYLFDTEVNYENLYNVDYYETPEVETNEDGTEVVEKICPQGNTYKRKFVGHLSESTIKGVWFLGEESQYIISGSDNAYIFIWEKETGELVRVLAGHDNVVNSICSFTPRGILCSAGIDDYIRVWTPGSFPDDHERKKRKEKMEEAKQESVSQRRLNSTFAFHHFYEMMLNQVRAQLLAPEGFVFEGDSDDSDYISDDSGDSD